MVNDDLGRRLVSGEIRVERAGETGAQPKAPATLPTSSIYLIMTPERARAFGSNLTRLQEAYETRSVVDTIERAIDDAVERIE